MDTETQKVLLDLAERWTLEGHKQLDNGKASVQEGNLFDARWANGAALAYFECATILRGVIAKEAKGEG